ncbi:MAG: trehalase family glycosidase [Eubacteriales bacterium]|nr:trehalase family glycosidase [Eubacteriales bacterium]
MAERELKAFLEGLSPERRQRLTQRVTQIVGHIKKKGLIDYQGKPRLTGYAYGVLYDWDLYFENLFLSYLGVSQYCKNGVEIFLDQQLPCGFIARALDPEEGPQYPRDHFKPFLAQIALLGGRMEKDYSWLRGNYYERLTSYVDYWQRYTDLDHNGLSCRDSAGHTGMDNQYARAGREGAFCCEGVDLNCYILRELEAMEQLADELGLPGDGAKFHARVEKLRADIQSTLWSEEDGFYFDRNERTGARIPALSAAGFIPLWLGIPDEKQAEALITRHLTNPDEFWRPYPVASWAATNPDYRQKQIQELDQGCCNWLGTTWAPVNYMIFQGLRRYGYDALAKELAEKTFTMCLDLNPVTREYYNAETGEGIGLNPFFGWSSLGLFLLLEYYLGYDASDLTRQDVLPLASRYLGIDYEAVPAMDLGEVVRYG